tara:strand:+ start:140 stop:661 length:522 start_codon:yes stop_codon:yes gene_type:complete
MKPITSINPIVYLFIRYILGVTMMAYGLIKILQLQFVLPSEVYSYELRQLDGVTLTWAFLGFSTWFSCLLGVFELVPGFLLLFRRTQLLGAILLFPSLLAVFLINSAYHFLPHMRVFTGVLLSLNILLLFSGFEAIVKFLKDTLSQSSGGLKESIINTLILVVLALLIVYNLT